MCKARIDTQACLLMLRSSLCHTCAWAHRLKLCLIRHWRKCFHLVYPWVTNIPVGLWFVTFERTGNQQSVYCLLLRFNSPYIVETGQWSQGTWPGAAVTLGMHAVASSWWPWDKAGATPRSGITMDLCPPMIMALLPVFTKVFTKISKCVLPQQLHFSLVLSTGTSAHHFYKLRKTALHLLDAWVSFSLEFPNNLDIVWRQAFIAASLPCYLLKAVRVCLHGTLGISRHCSCCSTPSGFQGQPSHPYFSSYC